MPQLIAMVIVVVGAIIYMFQTFGGTGDKIEGIAQKTSILTEINNVKNGVQLAVRANHVKATSSTAGNDSVSTLEGLARLAYFAEQINVQTINSASNPAATEDDYNIYQAISFGADNTMEISLVVPNATNTTARPGLFIDLSKGTLGPNSGFLEAQIANDLSALASIDRKTEADSEVAVLDANGDITTAGAVTGTDTDGKFTIYFKDIPSNIK